MVFLFIFAFISGLVTIIAPCIWPLLPVVLSASLGGKKTKSLGIVIGIMLSFSLVTLSISYILKLIPFDPNILRFVAVIVISFFGLTLIIPKLNETVEGWLTRLGGRFTPKNQEGGGLISGLVAGLSLGLVWSPCAGPILATIAAVSATRTVNTEVILVTVVYVIGIGIPIFIFSIAGSRFFSQNKWFSRYTRFIQQVFGVIMILTAIAIYINLDKVIELKLLNVFPSYSNFIYRLESFPPVKQELERLQKGGSTLPELGYAPEFSGISHWLNSDPLTMNQLQGKVVLVDFWTYTCINCIRTLPYVIGWYEKYKDKGFVVIGVHTPEFAFEKNTANVQNAIKQFGIHYPVAQDNDYSTWKAYHNNYWPAHYLIDAKGKIRFTEFGEGKYAETEKDIQSLLAEAGTKTDTKTLSLQNQTPQYFLTQETYLGLARKGDNFTLQGNWNSTDEYIQSTKGSKLMLRFYAKKVFLVITPTGNNNVVKVLLDGQPVPANLSGVDVKNGQIQIDLPRLYNLVDLKTGPSDHYLELDFETDGIRLFAFTFG